MKNWRLEHRQDADAAAAGHRHTSGAFSSRKFLALAIVPFVFIN
jgi:hypothetical protein